VHRGGYDPEQHLKDMALDEVSGEVLYPSQGLFYFKVADAALMSAISAPTTIGSRPRRSR
jgi:hypothetical protein